MRLSSPIFFMQSVPGLNASGGANELEEYGSFGELVSAVSKVRKGEMTLLLAADGYESHGQVPDYQLASPEDTRAEEFVASLTVLGVYDEPEVLLGVALRYLMVENKKRGF